MKKLIFGLFMLSSTSAFAGPSVECYREQKKPFEKQHLAIGLNGTSGVVYVMNDNTFDASEEGWYQIGFLSKMKVTVEGSLTTITGSGINLEIDKTKKLTKCFADGVCYKARMSLEPAIKNVAVMPLENTSIACRFRKK